MHAAHTGPLRWADLFWLGVYGFTRRPVAFSIQHRILFHSVDRSEPSSTYWCIVEGQGLPVLVLGKTFRPLLWRPTSMKCQMKVRKKEVMMQLERHKGWKKMEEYWKDWRFMGRISQAHGLGVKEYLDSQILPAVLQSVKLSLCASTHRQKWQRLTGKEWESNPNGWKHHLNCGSLCEMTVNIIEHRNEYRKPKLETNSSASFSEFKCGTCHFSSLLPPCCTSCRLTFDVIVFDTVIVCRIWPVLDTEEKIPLSSCVVFEMKRHKSSVPLFASARSKYLHTALRSLQPYSRSTNWNTSNSFCHNL